MSCQINLTCLSKYDIYKNVKEYNINMVHKYSWILCTMESISFLKKKKKVLN